jgi:hypothetical protein
MFNATFRQAKELMNSKGSVSIAFTDKPMTAKELSIRSLDQNTMKERQVQEIARQIYGNDETYTRNELKFRVGAPILMKTDESFKFFCDRMRDLNMTHEEKIKMMEVVSVTSKLTIKQMSEYIEKVFDMYAETVVWTFKESQ